MLGSCGSAPGAGYRSRFLAAVGAALACALAAMPASVLAEDKATAAANMAREAAKAYEAANYRRATTLCFNAWRTDPKAEYLWCLARSEDLAGMPDKAMEHYRAFVADPKAMQDKLPRAREYMETITQARVGAQIQEAETAQNSGDFKLAATLFEGVYRSTSSRPDLLYRTAVCEQSSEQWAAAQAHFQEYLNLVRADAPERAQAVARLESVRARAHPVASPTVPAQQTATSQPKPVAPQAIAADVHPDMPATNALTKPSPVVPAGILSVGATAQPGSAVRPLPWSLVGGGVLALAGGIGIFLWANGDKSTYDATFSATPAGPKSTLTRAESDSRLASINGRYAAAYALGGVGVAAAGIGTWLLLSGPGKVALAPGPVPAGLSIAWNY